MSNVIDINYRIWARDNLARVWEDTLQKIRPRYIDVECPYCFWPATRWDPIRLQRWCPACDKIRTLQADQDARTEISIAPVE